MGKAFYVLDIYNELVEKGGLFNFYYKTQPFIIKYVHLQGGFAKQGKAPRPRVRHDFVPQPYRLDPLLEWRGLDVVGYEPQIAPMENYRRLNKLID